MHLLEALERFHHWPVEDRDGVLPVSASLHGGDCWAELAAAGVLMAGYLGDETLTNDDLREALSHFESLLSAGIVTVDEWKQEAVKVIAAKMQDLEERGLLEMDAVCE